MVIRKIEYGPQPPVPHDTESYPNVREAIEKPRRAKIRPISEFNGRVITRVTVEPIEKAED